jgi:hypothetical protein
MTAQGQSGEWASFDTAPRDGKAFVAWSVTIMDVYDEDDRIIERGTRHEEPVIVYWFSIEGLTGGSWLEVPHRFTPSNRRYTHWLPLPPVPSHTTTEEGE